MPSAAIASDTLRQDEPALDARALRRCLGQFATGVTVMTAQHGDQRAGVTANSFTSLSLDPPLILWCIGRSSRSFALFQQADHFAVNILAADQVGVSQVFASAAADKFARIPWRPGGGGAPVIDGVVASLECRTEARHDGGDHVIIIGRVERFAQSERPVLLFAQGRYGVASDHPGVKPALPVSAGESASRPQDWTLISLLWYAHHLTVERFMELGPGEDMTIPRIRVLAGLYERPHQDLQQLARRTYLGQRDAEDAAAELAELGYVHRAADGTWSLTPRGRARKDDLRRKADAFEANRLLAGIAPADVACGRGFLEQLVTRHDTRA